MATRVLINRPRRRRLVFGHRPFAGGRGSALYYGLGSDPADVEYRKPRIFPLRRGMVVYLGVDLPLDGINVTKVSSTSSTGAKICFSHTEFRDAQPR